MVTIGNSQYAYITGRTPNTCRFCYDEGVWQRQADSASCVTGEFREARGSGRHQAGTTLWNEVIGFVFICFAVMFGFRAVRLYMDFIALAAGEAASADFGPAL